MTAQIIAGGLTGGLLVMTALSELVPVSASSTVLVAPATLVGLVSLPIGFRLYSALRERHPRGATSAAGYRAFLRATLAALSITEGAALFGVIAHVLSGQLMPLMGVAMHVLLAAVIWPSATRLDLFLEGAVGAADRPPDGSAG